MVRAKGSVGRLRSHLAQVQTLHANQPSQFPGGEDGVDVRQPVLPHLRPAGLELLGRTRHDADAEDSRRVDLFPRRKIAFDDGSHHLLRTLAGGEVVDEIGIKSLDKLDPAGRAAGEHGQPSAVLEAMQQLGAFLHDRQVCGEARIEHALEAEAPESGRHHADHVGAHRQTKLLAEGHGHGRGVLNDDHPAGIRQGGQYFLEVALLTEGRRGANGDALATIDTGGDIESFIEGRPDLGAGTAADEVDGPHLLHFLAHPNTLAAQDALGRVADNRRTRCVQPVLALFAGETALPYSESFSQGLQFAVAVADTVQAIVGVIGQQQLDDGLAGLDRTGGMRLDLHAVGDREGTARHQGPLTFDLDGAHPAGSRRRQIGNVAQGGHLDSHPAQRRQKHFPFFRLDRSAVHVDRNHAVLGLLSLQAGFQSFSWGRLPAGQRPAGWKPAPRRLAEPTPCALPSSGKRPCSYRN